SMGRTGSRRRPNRARAGYSPVASCSPSCGVGWGRRRFGWPTSAPRGTTGRRSPPRSTARRQPGASSWPAPAPGPPPRSAWRVATMGEGTSEGDPAPDSSLPWRRGERSDVASLLASLGGLEPTRLVEVLRVDQRERWAMGERVPATDYLRDFR